MLRNLNPESIKKLYWDEQNNINEIANKLDISVWQLYNFMNRNNILRRNRSEAGFLSSSSKPNFNIKTNLSIADEKLKIAGIMLYWAEGTLRGNTVDFVNCNPDMIKIFLKFLRQICGISEERLRVYLYVYSYGNLNKTKEYWTNITDIPLNQFTKPFVRERNLNISRRKLPYGLIHIRYNDKRLLKTIDCWINDFKNYSLLWAGTQVAKGGRLLKGSVPLKSGMEK